MATDQFDFCPEAAPLSIPHGLLVHCRTCFHLSAFVLHLAFLANHSHWFPLISAADLGDFILAFTFLGLSSVEPIYTSFCFWSKNKFIVYSLLCYPFHMSVHFVYLTVCAKKVPSPSSATIAHSSQSMDLPFSFYFLQSLQMVFFTLVILCCVVHLAIFRTWQLALSATFHFWHNIRRIGGQT